MDAGKYQEKLLESGFIQEVDSVYGRRDWVFVQDGAPCHTSDVSYLPMADECNIFPEWPPNSPDLNPIETLWGVMKHSLN